MFDKGKERILYDKLIPQKFLNKGPIVLHSFNAEIPVKRVMIGTTNDPNLGV